MNDKLTKFLTRYTVDCTITGRSLYYKFSSGIVLRVSDHYAANSDGIFSIIIPKTGTGYILVRRSTGESKIMTYDEVKKFVKALSIVQEALADTCKALDNLFSSKNIPVGYFSLDDLTPGQLQQVRLWYKQKGKKI